MPEIVPLPPTGLPIPSSRITNDGLQHKARQLESAFLAEMLGHAGLGSPRDSFGGGIGENQFSSFLRQEWTNLIVNKGGIGLSEQIFRSLTKGQEAR